jgi:hypothetical protein
MEYREGDVSPFVIAMGSKLGYSALISHVIDPPERGFSCAAALRAPVVVTTSASDSKATMLATSDRMRLM